MKAMALDALAKHLALRPMPNVPAWVMFDIDLLSCAHYA